MEMIPLKAISVAAAASALFVGIPTAHADVLLGNIGPADIQDWCSHNSVQLTARLSPANVWQCVPDRAGSGQTINVDLKGACALKYNVDVSNLLDPRDTGNPNSRTCFAQ